MVTFITSDLAFILEQIKIAERHAAGEDLRDILPNVQVPWGLRTVSGAYNNLVTDNQEFGAADNLFPRLVEAQWVPGYNSAGFVVDGQPRLISNLIVDQTSNNPAAVAANGGLPDDGGNPFVTSPGPDGIFGTADDVLNVFEISNVTPDAGLGAPFNAWMTFFGQFFDHGLDLVTKGGNEVILMPLAEDDPLFVPGSPTNFLVLTRATQTITPGEDGILGTADDGRETSNTTSPFVDQNQTYSSHPSHQVFLREYVLREVTYAGTDGVLGTGDDVTVNVPFATGELIQGANGGMATWGEVKEQARTILGIDLTDANVFDVPLLLTDQYGNFIPDALGMPQVVMQDLTVVSGNLAAPISLANAISTGHGFLDDIAHSANPSAFDPDGPFGPAPATPRVADADDVIGDDGDEFTYDDELLDAHYIAGDGRVNENIGLTAVHHVFHAEHNRLVQHTKDVALASGDVAFLNEWLLVDVTAIPTTPEGIAALVWDGERLFQAAKFGTEMQYQHLVFEEFGRTVQPMIDEFLAPNGYDVTIDPSIVAEFAHTVYRFGHSMLTETIERFDANFVPVSAEALGLVESFLNPLEFAASGLTPEQAAGAIIRGLTRQVGNEIDEFVTEALRNNLLGLPLDLASINIARGRDAGVPSLNNARAQFYAMTGDAQLKPYTSWADFSAYLKHPESLINFIAAYGTHDSIVNATTLVDKRAAAMLLVLGGDGAPADRIDFLYATGAYAGGSLGGLNLVDFWIGGLAEKQAPFGGLLGSSFNFVFETQLEALQNGDRFYYLSRTAGMHFAGELEQNSFAKMIMAHTDLVHLPDAVFSTPAWTLEVNQSRQFTGLGPDGRGDPDGGIFVHGVKVRDEVERDDPTTPGPDTNYLRYNGVEHVVLGGTAGNDVIISSEGDDTVYGDEGNDRLEGGYGNDTILGGDGDDIITDIGGDNVIKGGDGNDVIHVSPMEAGGAGNLLFGGFGKDFIVSIEDISTTFGGAGDDFIYSPKTAIAPTGNEGDDWIEWGGQDGAPGDNFNPVLADNIDGNDIFIGGPGFEEGIGEGGDDIFTGSDAQDKLDGMSGYDWVTYNRDKYGVTVDLTLAIFGGVGELGDHIALPFAASPSSILDRFESVEGISGSAYNDVLRGDDIDAITILNHGGASGSALTNIDLIHGLRELLEQAGLPTNPAPGTSAVGGNIILGGGAGDFLEGRGGDDLLHGDLELNVRISIRDPNNPEVEWGTANSMIGEVTARPGAPAYITGPLHILMLSGLVNPGQLQAVRELIDGGDGYDTAIFSGPLFTAGVANYTITVNGVEVDPLGPINISDTDVVRVTDLVGTEGTDTLISIERLQFADVMIQLQAGNQAPVGQPTISNPTPTEGELLTVSFAGVTDPDGPITGQVAYVWQVENDPGSGVFEDIVILPAGDLAFQSANGASFRVTGDFSGLSLRVKAIYIDANGVPEVVFSAATAPVIDVPDPIPTEPAPVNELAGTGDAISLARSDLVFILDQIKIAEAHAAGADLLSLVPNIRSAAGLRTVSGEGNNLLNLNGQDHSQFGAADNVFPRVTTPVFNTAEDIPAGFFGPGSPATPTSYAQTSGIVFDSQPRTISNLLVDQTPANPAAVAAALRLAGVEDPGGLALQISSLFVAAQAGGPAEQQAFQDALDAAGIADYIVASPGLDGVFGTADDHQVFELGNTAPDAGLSAPFNAWMTFFGQFFDHGLDLVTKGGSGTIFIPLQPDDPLYVPGGQTNFMVLTRATNLPGEDGILGTADDIHEHSNTTSPFVDQNQTYSSHPSHQVFLRHYIVTDDGPVSSGRLLTNHVINPDGSLGADLEGMSTWAVLKAQAASVLGIQLTDADVFHVPLLATDDYGNFIPGENGFVQIVTTTGLVEANPADNGGLGTLLPANTIFTGHAFLDDIAHNAVPTAGLISDDDSAVGLASGVFAIANDSFEADSLADGEPGVFTDPAGNYTLTPPTGWNMTGTGGVYAPDGTITSNVSHTGAQVAWLTAGASMSQDTGVLLREGGVYKLTVRLGDRTDQTFGGATVSLVTVDGDVIATIPVTAPTTEGGWRAVTLNTPAIPAEFVGEELRIVITNTGAGGGQVLVDNVALSVGVYDDELLDAHYMAGDGRVNENIGLTAVHHVFHSEHNRMVDQVKHTLVITSTDVSFLNEWLRTPLAANTVLPTDPEAIDAFIETLDWNGERLFQAAKFSTEMQYQHLVFEEFARTIHPNIDLFFAPTQVYDVDLDASIVAEFAHVVYRFGHSMLTETVDRFDVDFNAIGETPTSDQQLGLIAAFLNPLAYAASGATPEEAAGAIVRGVTRTTGNAIDEFVTDALRSNLLGLPLDLAALNIARGRDTGIPSLNEVRRQIYNKTGEAVLKPYASWSDFVMYLKHPESLVNFIAAYGTHAAITLSTTMADKRAAALLLVLGDGTDGDGFEFNGETYTDRLDFLNGTGAWASGPGGVTTTGLDDIDLWIGGLAEEVMPFGGMLGSTFTFIFENQLEALQDGDRFYYLERTAGLNFVAALEGNTFAKMIMANTDATHLPALVFSTPAFTLEVDQARQYTGLGLDGRADPTNDDPLILTPIVIRDNPATAGPDSNYLRYTGADHVVLGGTNGNDILISSEGDDTLWGDDGDDRLEGGHGNDTINGGKGDDIITDVGGDDVIQGDDGNDVIHGGAGVNLIIAGYGNDFIITGEDANESFGGQGNDFIFGTKADEQNMGGEGDDWLQFGTSDGAPGDNFDPLGLDSIRGNDVFIGGGENDKFNAEGGDDIMVGSAGFGNRYIGASGYDWANFKNAPEQQDAGVYVDMSGRFFDQPRVPGSEQTVLARFDQVEGLSGSRFNDVLVGTDIDATSIRGEGAYGSVLTNIALIDGLQELLNAALGGTPTFFDGGNIILGGSGSDILEGRGGDDIVHGDAWLNVRISVRTNKDGTGPEIDSFDGMDGHSTINPNDPDSLIIKMLNGVYNPGQLVIVREILQGTQDFDTAIFSGSISEYIVEVNGVQVDLSGPLTVDADDVVTVTDTIAGRDGVDRLIGVERINFLDASVTLFGDNNSPEGDVALINLYNTDDEAIAPRAGVAVRVDFSGVTDADNAGGALPNLIAVFWQIEVAPGVFEDILVEGTGVAAGEMLRVGGMTYMPVDGDVGSALRVRAIYQDEAGNLEEVFSAPTGPILAAAINSDATGDVLLDTFTPIEGTTITGALLNLADANGVAGAVLSFQWQTSADGIVWTDIVGATLPNFTPEDAQIGLLLRLEVTFADDAGFIERLTSDATAPVLRLNNAAEGEPTISGAAFRENVELTVSSLGISDPDGLSDPFFFFIWEVSFDGGDTWGFAGIGETFVPSQFEVGGILRVSASFIDDFGFGEFLVSAPTQIIGDFIDDNAAGNLLVGNAGDDLINGNGGNDTINGLDGNDILNGGNGTDIINGGNGADLIDGGGQVDIINGGAGNDVITVVLGQGGDTIDGGADNDTLNIVGTAGANVINVVAVGGVLTSVFGGAITSIESVTADGGGANDTLDYTGTTQSLIVNLASGIATGFTSITSIENVTGGTGADLLIGTATSNIINGAAGTDIINGGDGNDTLDGGTSNDIINGEGGNDTINYTMGQGVDTVIGGAGLDRLNVFGTAGANTLNVVFNGSSLTFVAGGSVTEVEQVTADLGGANDTLDYTTTLAGVTVNLNTGSASGFLSITSIERVNGGFGNDSLTGTATANIINGGFGNDELFGLAGNDTLNGGDGNDSLNGGEGGDTLDGGAGDDTFTMRLGEGADTIIGGAGFDTLIALGTSGSGSMLVRYNGVTFTEVGGSSVTGVENFVFDLASGVDTLRYATTANLTVNLATGLATGPATLAGIENVTGDVGNDTLTGDGNANILTGNMGADVLDGGAGNDTLFGGGDTDTLIGGLGDDIMDGGGGSDTFILGPGFGNDTINNFDANPAGGQDFLDISALGITAANFAARVSIVDLGADTLVTIDGSDTITLVGVNGNGNNVITVADFILGGP